MEENADDDVGIDDDDDDDDERGENAEESVPEDESSALHWVRSATEMNSRNTGVARRLWCWCMVKRFVQAHVGAIPWNEKTKTHNAFSFPRFFVCWIPLKLGCQLASKLTKYERPERAYVKCQQTAVPLQTWKKRNKLTSK